MAVECKYATNVDKVVIIIDEYDELCIDAKPLYRREKLWDIRYFKRFKYLYLFSAYNFNE
jgi:hypothetical protein